MLMRTLILRAVALAVVLSPALVFTQGGKTKPTTATYITKEEVDIVNSQGQGLDRNIKVVDIGHENFTVGIIHDSQTEGYYIVSGGGTMFTDGYIVNGRSIVLLVAESHVEKSRIPIGQ